MAEFVVEFDYDALHEDELTLRPGDVIKNVCNAEEGWMEGELNGRRGVFPDNFVKEVKKETKNEQNKSTASTRKKSGNVADLVNRMSTIVLTGGFQPIPPKKPKKKQCRVLFDYQPLNGDELELKLGDIIEVTEEVEEGWWSGSLNGKSGLFPSNFVEELEASGEEAEHNTTPPVNVTDDSPTEVATTPTSPPPASGNNAVGQPTMVPRMGFGNIFKDQHPSLRNTQREEKDQQPPSSSSAAKPAHPNMADSQREEGDGKHKAKEYCKVIFPYEAKNSDELHLKEGEIVHILSKDTGESGWWRGEVGGHEGVFPNNFVTIVPDPEKETPPSRGSTKSSIKHDLDQKPNKPPPPSKTPVSKPDVPSADKKPRSLKVQDKVSIDKTTPDGKPSKPLPPSVPRKKPVPLPPKKPEKPPTSSASFKQNGELPSMRPKVDLEPVVPVVPVVPITPKLQPVESVEKPSDSDLEVFDELSVVSDKLPHPTATRPKFHGRRLPAHFGGAQSPTKDISFDKSFKVDKEDGGKPKPIGSRKPSINNASQSPPLHRPTEPKPSPAVAPSLDVDASLSSRARLEPEEPSSQLDELRSQIKELLLSVELLKTQQMKEISELRGELEEERIKRVTLQMEVEDLKRTIRLT